MTKKDKYYHIITQYVKGDLSVEERHKIEKQALDDPFFFDALEGWMLLEGNNQDKKFIASLLLKIQGKKKETLIRRIIWPVAIAASLILFFTIGNILVNDDNQSLASNTPEKENAEIVEPEEQSVMDDPKLITQESNVVDEEKAVATEEEPVNISPHPVEKPNVNRDLAIQKKKSLDQASGIKDVATSDRNEMEDVATLKQEESGTIPASKTEAPKRMPLSTVNNSAMKNLAQNEMALTAGILEIIDPDLDDHIRKSLFMRNLKVFPGIRNSYNITFDSTLTITDIKLSSRKNDLSEYVQEFILAYKGWKKEAIPPNLYGQYHFPPKQK